MKAMLLTRIASLAENRVPLEMGEVAKPVPGPGQVLLRVLACGVCHTELDEIEGRTPPPVLPVIPGHEVIGVVDETGPDVSILAAGERVGVGWIFRSSGGRHENISNDFVATGRDANGGYAEYMVVDEHYAYPVPETLSDVEAAPLLCAGGVGYRALMQADLENGQPLGLTGFGGSGHIVLQLCKHLYPDSPVYVFARSAGEREFALQLGADWSGDTEAAPPSKPIAIIDTTPAWRPVLAALANLQPGGRLIINAIRKEDTDRHLMADIDYVKHLWQEKQLRSVANVTANDIRAMLRVAADAGIRPEVQVYDLADANTALNDLATRHVRGAKVLAISSADVHR